MNVLGTSTLNPAIFYTGKIAGYITWIAFIGGAFGLTGSCPNPWSLWQYLAVFLSILGWLITLLSLINLGRSTRFGLPVEETTLKTKGLYRYSRNPMYTGFGLLTVAAMLFTVNYVISILGIYSLIVYHFIILGEEKFLLKRFGNTYQDYTTKVRRYL